MAQPKPVRFEVFPNGEVGIVWDDGREDTLTIRLLRERCPCATCVDELTGERVLDVSKVPGNIRVEDWGKVGHYAVKIRFSDGHDTGIYTHAYLRELAEEASGSE